MSEESPREFDRLVEIMARLRAPGGCPWDRAQSRDDLKPYLVEETYEVLDAIEHRDPAMLREELGDLLLQVVFHARIAAEDPDDPWTIDDVADGIVTKLVARHPHVFGEATAETAEQVEANWHALKAKEKGRESVTDGIPSALPALVHAGKVLSRSATLGDRLPALAARETAEAAMADVTDEAAFGDLLVALVALGRERGFDAESAARVAARRRIAEIRAVEGLA